MTAGRESITSTTNTNQPESKGTIMTMTMHVDTMADVERVDTSTTDLETVGEGIGNESLTSIARGEKVGRVSAGQRARGEVRGWTMGGRVD